MVFLALSEEGAGLLSEEAAAVAFVHDAFTHMKVIGATPGAQALLDKAGVVQDDGVMTVTDEGSITEFVAGAAGPRIWEREPSVRTIY